MTITAYISLFCAALGALVYLISSNAKFSELGRLTFFAGLLSFLIWAASKVLHIG